MSQNKKSPASPVHAFRQNHVVTTLPENLQTVQDPTSYLVPKAAKDMGQLIGTQSDRLFAEWGEEDAATELADAYRELAATTAVLLDWFSVGVISDEAAHSVSHQLAATVDPLVSLNARVDHLYRAFVQDEMDSLRDDAQKLWAALEFRCEAVTGKTFAQVLAEA